MGQLRGVPLSDYTPELLPLSIGTGSSRISARGTLILETGPGWFANGSAAYTWRSKVQLDRPYYFTDDQGRTSLAGVSTEDILAGDDRAGEGPD